MINYFYLIFFDDEGVEKLRIAVCDDDAACLEGLRGMLEQWAAANSARLEIDCYDNGDTLLRGSALGRYDLIFLDIVMPLLSGIETARELRDRDKTVKIVFLTTTPDFALQSYSVKAADYCLKPISYEKLKDIMDDCAAQNRQEPESLTLKTVGGYQKIYLYDIEYIEAQNKRVFFFLRAGKVVEVIQPLYTFENQLSDSKGFFKCHRSYLVYLPNVDYFNTTEIKTKSGRRIPIARGYGKAFHDAYFAALFRE